MNSEYAGLAVWFTGLSGSGKSTLSEAAYRWLKFNGHHVELLDGDEIRRHLSPELGFSPQDRHENIRRIAFIAELLTRNGIITLVSTISPYRAGRDLARSRIPNYMEIYVNASLEACEGRDTKGLYRRARAGEIKSFTGLDDPYEIPERPDVECFTDLESVTRT